MTTNNVEPNVEEMDVDSPLPEPKKLFREEPLDPNHPVAGWITNFQEGERMLLTCLILDTGPKYDERIYYEGVGLQANNRGGFPKLQCRPGKGANKTWMLNVNEIRLNPARYTIVMHVFSRDIPSANEDKLRASKCVLVVKEVAEGEGKSAKMVKKAVGIKYRIETEEEDGSWTHVSDCESTIDEFLDQWRPPTLDWLAWDQLYEKALAEAAASGAAIEGIKHTLRAGTLCEQGGWVSPRDHRPLMSMADYPSFRQLLLAAKVIPSQAEYVDVHKLKEITREMEPNSQLSKPFMAQIEQKLMGQA